MLCVHVCVRAGKLPLLLSLSLPSLTSAPPPQHLSPPLHLPSLLTFLSSSLLFIFFPFFFRISWPFLHLLTFPSLLHDTASCYVIQIFSPPLLPLSLLHPGPRLPLAHVDGLSIHPTFPSETCVSSRDFCFRCFSSEKC